jgi:2-polyprenyl-6-methoxyphenol hydroxylase-like FAD-dependent oxidoreductase
MDHIGIYDKLKVSGYNYEELAFTNGSGEVLGKFLNGSQKVYNFPALRIHRTLVRETLISELRSQDIPIYYDKKCLGIKGETESGATVQFEDGSTAEAKFVVGTDGIHSRVRSFITPNGQPEFSGLMGVMGTVMADDLMKAPQDYQIHLPCMLFGASGSFAIMPASPDGREIGYFATIEAKDRGKEGWQQLESEKDELKSMLSDRFLANNLHWPLLVRELCGKTALDTLTSWP